MKRFEMKRSAISLVLIFVIILTFGFSGCGAGKTDNNTTAASDTMTASSTTEKVVEAPAKLTIMTQDCSDSEYPITGPKNSIQLELEKMANVDITWEAAFPGDSYNNLVQTRLASGTNLPDLIMMTALSKGELYNLATNGIIIPLNDLIDKYAPNIKKAYWQEFPSALKADVCPDGKLYWVGGLAEKGPAGFSGNYLTATIRQDWLTKVGITKLPQTLDEFHTALKTMQDKDANGNGKKDEVLRIYGLSCFFANISDAFGLKDIQKQSELSFTEVNGKVVNSYILPQAKAWAQWMAGLFKEGLIDPESLTMNWEKFQAKGLTNDMSADLGGGAYGAMSYNTLTFKDIPGVDYVVLDPLTGPDGKCVVGNSLSLAYYPSFITKDCKNPAAAMRWLDTTMSKKGGQILGFGMEGVDFAYDKNGKPQVTQAFLDKSKADPKYYLKMGKNIFSSCIQNASGGDWADLIKGADTTWPGNGAGTIAEPSLRREDASYSKVLADRFAVGVTTPEEKSALDSLSKDLWTYMDEMILKFATGSEPIENWDVYVAKCNVLGLDKATEVSQKMRDRWNNTK